jgi:diguanylate cyclase (GGDEF)-like protein/PAS domain S-box-containing protein
MHQCPAHAQKSWLLPGLWSGAIIALIRTALTCLLCMASLACLPAQALHSGQQLKIQTLQSQRLVVGSEQEYPPFATGMSDATAGGFSVNLWKAVATESGLNYTIVVRPLHQLLQEFKEGKIDVLINLAQSDERRQYVDFTVPHVIVRGAIFTRKGNTTIHAESDLAGKSLIVLNRDLAHDYALAKGWGAHLTLVTTAAEGMRLLAAGGHDALLLNKLAGMQTLQAQRLTNIVALKPRLDFQQKFSFAVHKEQPELLYTLNEGLAVIKSNGSYNRLYEQWFGIYEVKEIGWSDLLKYIIPLVTLFLIVGLYFWDHRRLERKQTQAAIAASMDLLRTIIDTAPVRVFWKDMNLRYLGCNTAFAQDAGMAHPDQLIGKDDYQMSWTAQADLYRADDWAVIAAGNQRLSYEEPQTTPNGRTIWLRTSKVPLRNEHQETIGLLGVYEDITERKRLENERAEALDRLTKIASRVPGVVFQYLLRADGSSCFPFASDAMRDIFRLRPEQVRLDASALLALIHPDDIEGVVASLKASALTLTTWRHGFRVKFDDGAVRWLLANAVPQRGGDSDGAVLWHGFATDNTEQKRAEAIFRGLFDQSVFLAGILDSQGRLIEVNSTALHLAGVTRDQVMGRYFPDTPWWQDKQDRNNLIEVLTQAYAGHPGSFEACHPMASGEQINVMFSAMPIALDDDDILVAVVGVDISARKRLEDQVRQLAFHDPLTKLPNRRLLSDRLVQAMANSRRTQLHGALLFLDLDNFKSLNDTQGHDAGDLLLLDVAQRLKSCVRETDTVARIGGDEFIVMLSDLHADKTISTDLASTVAEKIRVMLAAPYFLKVKNGKKASQTIKHRCTASIGVVLFIDHEASQEDLLKWADAAMYQAKEDGRNRVRVHTQDG